MKMPLTEVQVKCGDQHFHYVDIPQAKLKPLLGLLKKYLKDTVPWRELAKDRIQAAGGESAYMLKVARSMADMTQTELAKKLHMPQGNLSQIECGKRSIGKSLAKKLGKILGKDYRVFL